MLAIMEKIVQNSYNSVIYFSKNCHNNTILSVLCDRKRDGLTHLNILRIHDVLTPASIER